MSRVSAAATYKMIRRIIVARCAHFLQGAFHFGYARYRERIHLPLLNAMNDGGSRVRLWQAKVLPKSDPSVDDLAQKYRANTYLVRGMIVKNIDRQSLSMSVAIHRFKARLWGPRPGVVLGCASSCLTR